MKRRFIYIEEYSQNTDDVLPLDSLYDEFNKIVHRKLRKNKDKTDDDPPVISKKKHIKYNDEEIPYEKVVPKKITCPICYDDVNIPYVTICNHNFCYSCIDKLISSSTNTEWACPICRKICK